MLDCHLKPSLICSEIFLQMAENRKKIVYKTSQKAPIEISEIGLGPREINQTFVGR